ncbi:MAG: HAMP domain-containing sensor histidine kinase [Bacilli bacterium]
MNYFEGLIINIVFLLFPLLIYLLYTAYQKNISREEDGLFCSIALVSSLYLIMRYGKVQFEGASLIALFNIPLLIAYLKGKQKTSIVLSIVLIIYGIVELNYNFYFVLLEYVIYFFMYALIGYKKLTKDRVIQVFVLVKTFFLSMKVFYINPISISFTTNFGIVLFSMILFYLVANIIFVCLQKGEDIISLNQTLKELEKEKFLRNSLFKITHEIKNPISVCKGYLDMIDLNDTNKVHKYIPIVSKEIARTLTLMDDFLDYTKIKINPEVMDIYYLLEDTTMQLTSLFNGNGIFTNFSIPDTELYIIGDYNRIKQVLINLFKNSVEAINSSNSSISGLITLSTRKHNSLIDIIIKDNGIGMNEETLKHLSEMFYTTKVTGTGLGVALSKEIIELHHGSIRYDSEYEKGTVVIITLPVNV